MAPTTIAERHRVRTIATPEGISLPFEVAGLGERFLAFAIDAFLVHAVVLAVALLAGLQAQSWNATGLPLALALLTSFFLRNFYFVYCELRFGGQTLGKRWLRLRVISRDGGPLTAEAIFARNLTRDLEVFLPLAALIQPGLVVPSGPGWAVFLGSAWMFVFALLPFFSRDHLRCGDLVGGTLVVRLPPALLLADLADEEPPPAGWDTMGPSDARYHFTPGQLDLYGVHELQVLEDVLRGSEGYRDNELAARVCETIKTKIEWPRQDWDVDPHHFLFAFYKAQRARLEHHLLFGKRRERKRE